MEQDWVILRLPENLLTDLRLLAAASGVTPGQYLRDHIAEQAGAAAPVLEEIPLPRTDASDTNAMREMVSDILFTAKDWTSLQSALVREGFALKADGYALAIYAWPSDQFVCKSMDLGLSYAQLIRQLGSGEPPHPNTLVTTAPMILSPMQQAG
ncbi:MAG: hypothetical protein AAFX45_07625 [Pseudomonadota bacterium]